MGSVSSRPTISNNHISDVSAGGNVPAFVPNATSNHDNVSDAALLLSNGFPGYQYTIVDPDSQYQKHLLVVIQALSGVDPINHALYSATLSQDGMTLHVKIPLSPVFLKTKLMVNKRVSWMSSNNPEEYMTKKHIRLGGLGPAIAQVQSVVTNEILYTTWNLPLSEACDEVVGGYSINNFPAAPNAYNQSFYPVLIEFKLSS